VRRETGQEVAGARSWECWPAAGEQRLKATCENADDWRFKGWSGWRDWRRAGSGARRKEALSQLVACEGLKPGRIADDSGDESKW